MSMEMPTKANSATTRQMDRASTMPRMGRFMRGTGNRICSMGTESRPTPMGQPTKASSKTAISKALGSCSGQTAAPIKATSEITCSRAKVSIFFQTANTKGIGTRTTYPFHNVDAWDWSQEVEGREDLLGSIQEREEARLWGILLAQSENLQGWLGERQVDEGGAHHE